jgi:4-diphosphocytidyl-2-C-methyl-D-erythritol kinase
MNSLKLLSPAKVNLRLEVLGKRDDGYHEIRTIIQRVSLYDEVELALTNKGITLDCDSPGVPRGRANIAYRAAELFLENTGIKTGVEIFIRKRIPLAAGLGGGSSNAAAVLMGLRDLLKLRITDRELLRRSIALGADVPFFIFKGPALAEGIGEKLTKITLPARIWFLLIHPGGEISTEWAYQNVNLKLTEARNKIKIKKIYRNINGVAELLLNDLERAAIKKFPRIQEIKEKLSKLKARGVLMSGSGLTVFGLFEDEAAATRAQKEFKLGKEDTTFIVQRL